MNRWARMRKRIVFMIVLVALILLVGLPLYYFFYQAPTCSDGRMNGDETGMDCGGSCTRLCTLESLPVVLKGDPRVLRIATSTFEVVAILDNTNSAEVKRARYSLEVYGEGVVPIKILEGEIYIPPSSKFAIFEGPFTVESGRVPTRASLTWELESFVWERVALTSYLKVNNVTFTRLSPPRLEALIENTSTQAISNVDLTALISDRNGNLIGASKTFVERITGKGEALAVFSWPEAFSAEAASTEILVKVLPNRSFIR